MKTGIIVYIAGKPPAGRLSETKAAVNSLRFDADRVEIASPYIGHSDVHDAWWSLTSKGMQKIMCAMAEFDASGQIRVKEQMLRLCG